MLALDIDRPGDRLLFPWQWNEDACPIPPAPWTTNPVAESLLKLWLQEVPAPNSLVGQEDEMLPSQEEQTSKSSLIVADGRTQEERDRALVALLDSWLEATEEEKQEQRETWEALRQALDEDRLSDRKLFP